MRRVPPELYGFPIKYIVRACRVDITTARRWKRGAICPPKTALMILSRDLGHMDPDWRGWTLSGGHLLTPEGVALSPGDARALQLVQAQLGVWRDENRKLRQELEALKIGIFEDQPSPEQWEIAVG